MFIFFLYFMYFWYGTIIEFCHIVKSLNVGGCPLLLYFETPKVVYRYCVSLEEFVYLLSFCLGTLNLFQQFGLLWY